MSTKDPENLDDPAALGEAVITADSIYAAEDEEWVELTPLGVPSAGAHDGTDTDSPDTQVRDDANGPGRLLSARPQSAPAAFAVPPPQDSPPTRTPSGNRPALRHRARALLTDKLVAEERDCDAQLARLRVRGMSRSVGLAVSSIKGGIGKTTIARSLADAFQGGLRQNTLLVDLDLEWGTAVATAPAEAQRESSILDVYRRRDEIHDVGDLLPHLMSFGSGALLLERRGSRVRSTRSRPRCSTARFRPSDGSSRSCCSICRPAPGSNTKRAAGRTRRWTRRWS